MDTAGLSPDHILKGTRGLHHLPLTGPPWYDGCGLS